jgi:hypothetical protein
VTPVAKMTTPGTIWVTQGSNRNRASATKASEPATTPYSATNIFESLSTTEWYIIGACGVLTILIFCVAIHFLCQRGRTNLSQISSVSSAPTVASKQSTNTTSRSFESDLLPNSNVNMPVDETLKRVSVEDASPVQSLFSENAATMTFVSQELGTLISFIYTIRNFYNL